MFRKSFDRLLIMISRYGTCLWEENGMLVLLKTSLNPVQPLLRKGKQAQSELSLPRVKGKQNKRLKEGGVDVGETGNARHVHVRTHAYTHSETQTRAEQGCPQLLRLPSRRPLQIE